ncbi:unnamed protein product [Prunus armeniaca]
MVENLSIMTFRLTSNNMDRIIREMTCPQTPQQNGVAQRKNRHLLETTRALLIGAHVPRHHWDDAIVAAVHLINHMPFGVLTFETPLQVLAQHGLLPFVLVLKPQIFECVAFVHLDKSNVANLILARFIVFLWVMPLIRKSTASNLENEEILLCTETIDRPKSGARDCSLPQSNQSPIHSNQSLDPPDSCEDGSYPSPTPTDNTEQRDEDYPLTQQYQRTKLLRISLRQNRGKPPNHYSPNIGKTSKYPITNHVSTKKLSKPLKAFVHQLSTIHIPTKVVEAFKDHKWVQAIKEEMKALEKN